MNIRIIYILLFVILAACSDNNEDSIPVLSVDVETVDFAQEGGTKAIKITTNVGEWDANVTEGDNWCLISKSSNTLTIRTVENEGREVREAKVLVSGGGISKIIQVRQLGAELALLISKQLFTVDAIGGNIAFDITTNVDEFEIETSSWINQVVVTRSVEMVTSSHNFKVAGTTDDAERSGEIIVKEKGGTLEAKVVVTQKGLNNYESSGIDGLVDDIKVAVESASASSFETGAGIELSFDGDMTTLYHSNWTNSGEGYFPITLTYNFPEGTDMDYFVYYPRQSGANGNFKEVEIRVQSNANVRAVDEWTTVMTKDFGGSGSATRVEFPTSQIGVKSVQFIVKSGAGDGQGFAACAEMEFYKKNPDAFDYSVLFTDQTCSELKPGVTDEDIENCSYSFYKNIAYYMKAGKYPDEFRIQTYKAYPHPDEQALINKTSTYSLLDNPTGMSIGTGDKLVVFVGETYGQNLSLRVQNLDQAGKDGFGGSSYPLAEGVNKLSISEKGLIYIMYHTNDYQSALPVKIHIATGKVNGYFDSQKHEASDWNRLINNAVDAHFDVVGKYAHLTFPTSRFRTTTPDGKALIDTYDKLVNAEMELLGLYKYDKVFKNRMYFNVMYNDSYMYATNYHTGYQEGTLGELCDVNLLNTTACWGPAHEVGHSNQTRPGMRWLGTTEVTNNIMSEYVQTTIFGQNSRIQTEDMGEIFRNRYSKAWSTIISTGTSHAESDDVFCKLVPFWQLELYLGKVLGKTPLQQTDKGGFYPDVYEHVRTHDDLPTAGDQQTEFVYICSLYSGYNLLDFFTKWGFLTPTKTVIDDYGEGTLEVTQDRINEITKRVEALGYPKPDVALEYISDNTWEWYKNKPSVVAGSNATRSGKVITISNWQYVVAYEVKDASGNLVFISSGETTPSTTDKFTLPSDWVDGYKLYAVSVMGERTEIPFTN